MIWTEEAVATMRDLLAKGASLSAVATELRCSRNAVSGKVRRMGIENRCHVGGNKYSSGKSLAERNAQHVPKPRAPKPPPRALGPPPEPPHEPLRVRMENVGSGQCRFPLWPDDRSGFPLFEVCGLPSGFRPWCPHCALKVFGHRAPSERMAA